MYKNYLKRIIDILASVSVLLISTPIFIPCCLLLYAINKRQIFFYQARPGLNEKIFKIYKLKTMTEAKDEKGKLLPDKDRLFPLGSFIRKYSIDEIPQLFNVLLGQMSLIGPRPLLIQYLPLYNATQRRRHEVRPGITGWAQVNGRNKIPWGKKFELDVWYVDNISFFLDIKILYLTVLKIFFNSDVNQSDDRPMLTFTGSEKQ